MWDHIEKETDRAESGCVAFSPDAEGRRRVRIDEAGFERLDPVIAKTLIHRCICRAAGEEKDVEAVHVADTLALFGKQAGKTVDLPYGVKAERIYSGVLLSKTGREKRPDDALAEVALNIPGETYFPGTGQIIECDLLEKTDDFSPKEIPQKSYTKCFDYDIIKYSLSARCRRPGDYLAVDGKGSRQKLKAYFINEKVPREERDRKLLIADGDHVVWIPGMRMSTAYQIGSRTKRILMIKITEDREYVRNDQSIDPGRRS